MYNAVYISQIRPKDQTRPRVVADSSEAAMSAGAEEMMAMMILKVGPFTEYDIYSARRSTTESTDTVRNKVCTVALTSLFNRSLLRGFGPMTRSGGLLRVHS